jgi:hypothetical protein
LSIFLHLLIVILPQRGVGGAAGVPCLQVHVLKLILILILVLVAAETTVNTVTIVVVAAAAAAAAAAAIAAVGHGLLWHRRWR